MAGLLAKLGIRSPEAAATLSTPAAGTRRLYPKSNGWYDLDSSGREHQIGNEPTMGWDLPTGFFRANLTSVRSGHIVNNLSPLTTQREYVMAIWLNKGEVVTSLTFITGGTAVGTPTNYWFSLRDQNRALLRQTADQTTTAWGINVVKTLNLTSTYTATYTGLYYVGIMVKATTLPALWGVQQGAAQLSALPPIIAGQTADTALTTTAPASGGAITGNGAILLCLLG